MLAWADRLSVQTVSLSGGLGKRCAFLHHRGKQQVAVPWLARGWLWRLPDKDPARKERHKVHHVKLRQQLA